MIGLQVLLKLEQIPLKSLVRLYDAALALRENARLVVIHAVFLHQEGDDEGRAAGHAHLAMHEHVVVDQHGFDVGVRLVQVRVDAHVFGVLDVDPLAVADARLLELGLNRVVVVGPVVDDSQHAIDLQLLEVVHPIKDINATQVQVSLILRWFLLFLVDVDDVAALLVIERIHVKELLSSILVGELIIILRWIGR